MSSTLVGILQSSIEKFFDVQVIPVMETLIEDLSYQDLMVIVNLLDLDFKSF